MTVESREPAVSVVVASFGGEAALERCLSSLAVAAMIAPSTEVIVATEAPPETVARLATRFPEVRFLQADPGTSVFRLRSLGVAQAQGGLVALLEDHCTVAPEWLAALCAAHQAGYAVVGGPIDNGRAGIYSWALYFCEYSAYMPPLPEGPVPTLLAANAAYSREALASCRPVWQDAFYDNEVPDALRAAGFAPPYLADKARVYSHLGLSLRQAMAHLFAGGRRFGGYRRSRSSAAGRLFWALAVPAVPLLWLGRIVRRVTTRRPARLGTLALGLPYVLCLLTAWATGEAVGYLGRLRPRTANRDSSPVRPPGAAVEGSGKTGR